MNDLRILDNSKTTIKQLDQFALEQGVTFPTSVKRKAEKINYLRAKLSEDSVEEVEGYRDEVIELVPMWSPRGNEPKQIAESRANWVSDLKEYGWCVVPIDGWKDDFTSMFFDYLESCCENFKRDDHTTWKTANMVPLLHGILKNGFGHTELQYEIRELCTPIFAQIWDLEEEELLCSFDGGCFLNNKMKSKRNETLNFNLKDMWLHVDTPRSFGGNDDLLECYQGLANFAECGEMDGGLVLAGCSSTEVRKTSWVEERFHDYMEQHPSAGYKWTRAQTVDPLFDDVSYIKVCAHPGELVIWHGMMFHCNVPPTRSDPSAYRMCTYVSMQPRNNATAAELKKRVKLYEEGRMTGHWCYGQYFEANPKMPRTYGNADVILPPEPEIAELNTLRRCLIGYE